MKKFWPPDGKHFCFVMTDGASAPPVIEGSHTVVEFPENGKTPNERGRVVDFLTEPSVVITSCPIIISDFPREQVMIIYSSGEGAQPEFQTFGTSINKIMRFMFSRNKTIGDVATQAIEKWRTKLKRTDPEKVDALLVKFHKEFGESAETVLFYNAANERKKKGV